MEALQIRIAGRVQGVGFRAWTARFAKEHALNGWVRNLPDGSVEVLVEGAADALDRFRHAVASGPPSASVASVTVVPVPITGAADFQVIR